MMRLNLPPIQMRKNKRGKTESIHSICSIWRPVLCYMQSSVRHSTPETRNVQKIRSTLNIPIWPFMLFRQSSHWDGSKMQLWCARVLHRHILHCKCNVSTCFAFGLFIERVRNLISLLILIFKETCWNKSLGQNFLAALITVRKDYKTPTSNLTQNCIFSCQVFLKFNVSIKQRLH